MKIDFVIAWVDGNDPAWLKEKEKFKPGSIADANISRYRDWDLMKYWFRGVENYAPWVNKIYFLTWGHYPEWLNLNNEKLEIVRHSDYIPGKYLPTFNSHTIELNINRIKSLSEHFVYFNDDMFLISSVTENDFFEKGLPKDSAVLSVHCNQRNIIESHIPVSMVGVINDYFDMKEVISNNITKWLNYKYGIALLLRTICLLPSPRFPGFWQHHLPSSFLKSTFDSVWKEEESLLDEVCSHKFRTAYDVSQWLMREWQICEGKFVPRSYKFGKSFHLDRKGVVIVGDIKKYIEKQKGHVVVINDGEMKFEDFQYAKQSIADSFEMILPQKSHFEK